MPKAKSLKQWRFFGAMAGKGVKWARDAQRGRKMSSVGGGKKKKKR